MLWTIVHDPALLAAALPLARGCYQRALLNGSENLSGSTLRGKAGRYGSRYAASRAALLKRMTRAGIPWAEARGTHGKRLLVIGRAAAAVAMLGGDAKAVAGVAA